MESIPHRPTRRAATPATKDLVGEEMDQSSDGTAQKRNQANQASVALALEVGGCLPVCSWRLARSAFFHPFVCAYCTSVHAFVRESLFIWECLWVRVLHEDE